MKVKVYKYLVYFVGMRVFSGKSNESLESQLNRFLRAGVAIVLLIKDKYITTSIMNCHIIYHSKALTPNLIYEFSLQLPLLFLSTNQTNDYKTV